tara:strand:- start:315 stop:560 length:246 start_codon:yes stop_codon:yes gene_type:complete
MNQLTLLVIILVLFCYFGGKNCPSILKKNKEMLLGVAGGLILCSFFGIRLIEGLGSLVSPSQKQTKIQIKGRALHKGDSTG